MKCIKGTRCELWTENCELWPRTCDLWQGRWVPALVSAHSSGRSRHPPLLTQQQYICKTLATPIIIIIWIRFERVLKYSCEQKISKCLHVCVHYDPILDCVCVCVTEEERETREWVRVCLLVRVPDYYDCVCVCVFGEAIRGRPQSESSMTKSRNMIQIRFGIIRNTSSENLQIQWILIEAYFCVLMYELCIAWQCIIYKISKAFMYYEFFIYAY